MSDFAAFTADRSNEADKLNEIVELMQDLKDGHTVRVVSETQDVMVRVVGKVEVWRD